MLNRVAFFLVLLSAGVVLAAPGLPITKPPLQPVPSWTGPTWDPDAVAGQWFYRPLTQGYESRPYEFYDNVLDFGGGWASNLAIKGVAANLQYTGNNIVAFDIIATITNDMPALSNWVEGGNSHGESTLPRQQVVTAMQATKLSIEFAISDLQNLPNGFSDPYRQGYLPYIIAANEDQLAWYCYTPGSTPQGQSTAVGNFYVPTWDYGDIPLGQSATRTLHFAVDGMGLDPLDPRFAYLVESYNTGSDLLSNRTTSLKISNWIDNMTPDLGVPYPVDPYQGSDCSVFFRVPEPASLSLLALGGLAMLRRRKH